LVQWQVSSATSVQTEVRNFEWSRGDLGIPIVKDVDESYRSDFEKKLYRVSVRHEIDPSNALLMLAEKQKASNIQRSMPSLDASIVTNSDASPERLETQYVSRSEHGNFVIGLGVMSDDQSVYNVASDAGFVYFVQQDYQDDRHAYGYLYYSKSLMKALNFDLGLVYDRKEVDQSGFFDIFGSVESVAASFDADQWSPKFGIAWHLSEHDVLRLAAFRTFQRGLVGDATLEPTQVAGFNQFFDDVTASDAKNFALAYDGVVGGSRFGAGLSTRKSDYARIGSSQRIEPSENTGSIYFSDAMTQSIVFGAKAIYVDRDFDIPSDELDSFREIETLGVPFFVEWFLSRDWSLHTQVAYYHQRVSWFAEGPDFLGVVPHRKEDNLWVADVKMRYDLPMRYGFLDVGVNNVDNRSVNIVSVNPQFLQFYPGRFTFVSFSINL
jgi:hypothetical protein